MRTLRCVFSGDPLSAEQGFPRRIVDDVWQELTGSLIIAESTDAAGARSAVDVERRLRLVPMQVESDEFSELFLSYMRRLSAVVNEERADVIWRSAPAVLQQALACWDEVQVFEGASRDPEGGLVIRLYADDGITPKYYALLDGLKLDDRHEAADLGPDVS
eukprot:tig00021127_g18708.t1